MLIVEVGEFPPHRYRTQMCQTSAINMGRNEISELRSTRKDGRGKKVPVRTFWILDLEKILKMYVLSVLTGYSLNPKISQVRHGDFPNSDFGFRILFGRRQL